MLSFQPTGAQSMRSVRLSRRVSDVSPPPAVERYGRGERQECQSTARPDEDSRGGQGHPPRFMRKRARSERSLLIGPWISWRERIGGEERKSTCAGTKRATWTDAVQCAFISWELCLKMRSSLGVCLVGLRGTFRWAFLPCVQYKIQQVLQPRTAFKAPQLPAFLTNKEYDGMDT